MLSIGLDYIIFKFTFKPCRTTKKFQRTSASRSKTSRASSTCCPHWLEKPRSKLFSSRTSSSKESNGCWTHIRYPYNQEPFKTLSLPINLSTKSSRKLWLSLINL